MWAVRLNRLECGIILSQWSPATLQKRDSEGLNPAQIAVSRGWVKLASELEKIQNNRTSSEFAPGLSLGFSVDDMSLSMSPSLSSMSSFPQGSVIHSVRNFTDRFRN